MLLILKTSKIQCVLTLPEKSTAGTDMKSNTNQSGVSRRDVLRATTLGVGVVGFGTVGIRSLSSPVTAQSGTETIYMTDSASLVDEPEPTRLFAVELDTTSEEAILDELEVLPEPNFTGVDAIAASPNGETVYLIDRLSLHLGTYDVTNDTFTDEGQISNLPERTVLASFGLDGVLYAVSNSTNALYSIDFNASPPTATELVELQGVDVSGADIAFDSNGILYLHSNAGDTLYTIDYDSSSPTYGQATTVGSDEGTSFTGLAVRDAGLGDLVGSSRELDALVAIDKTDGQRGTVFDMVLNGDPYDYRNGDLTVGRLIDDTCVDCALDEAVKYEFEDGDFVLDGEGDDGISYTPGSYVTKEDEENEPISVTFETDYCTLWAVVKAGRELDVQELDGTNGEVTATAPDKYAISFVEFYCTEQAAQDAADDFPSNSRGSQGRGR